MASGVSKRVFDLLVTVLAGVAWVPVLLAAMLVLLIKEGRPIFYCSMRRTGDACKLIPKFRTMVRNAEELCNRQTVPIENGVSFLNISPDSHLYSVTGRFIERFGLTELPQLLLVLKGDMSLVGNRPLPNEVVLALKKKNANVENRFDTKAGLTGPVQLVGRVNVSDRERLYLESEYCRIASSNYSWRLDFMILLYTVLITLRVVAPLTVPKIVWLMHHWVPEGESLIDS